METPLIQAGQNTFRTARLLCSILLLAVFLILAGGHADHFGKDLGEIQWIGKTGQSCNIFDRCDAIFHKHHCVPDPKDPQIFGQTHAELFLEG